MRVQCSGTKRDGTPCTLPATGPSGRCWSHDPAHADARRRGAVKGGKGKASRGELAEIKISLKALADDVLSGQVERGDAAVVAQLFNVYLRAVSVGLAVREQEEILERLSELEREADRPTLGRRGS